MTSGDRPAASTRPLFLLTFLAWAGGLAGGDRHVLEVAARWKDHVELAVLAPPEAFPTIESFLGDVRTHAHGSAGASAARRGPLLALEYVRRALAVVLREPRISPDVVLAASHFSPDAAGLTSFARRGAVGVAYVYHLVARRERTDLRTLWSKIDERVALTLLRRNADLVFVSNRQTETDLVARGFAPIRTDVGVDLAGLRTVPLDRRGPTALFLARMVDSKGVLDAVEAWALVRRSLPAARLIMAGDGPLREAGIRRAAELGIVDAIDWPGFVSEDEKRCLLGESALFLAPSYEEGWGISVAEALGTRLPVIAYRLPALDELFPSAYTAVATGDVDGLADAAVRLLNDRALAQALGDRGLTLVQRYDVARVAELELEKILAIAPRGAVRATQPPVRRRRPA